MLVNLLVNEPLLLAPESHKPELLVVVCVPLTQFHFTESFTLIETLEGLKSKFSTVTLVTAAWAVNPKPHKRKPTVIPHEPTKRCVFFIVMSYDGNGITFVPEKKATKIKETR